MSAPVVPLPHGGGIPQLGFGTYKLAAADAEAAVRDALEAGYRHVDTAAMYRNEAAVGRALAASGLPREELFVTTKLDNPDHAPAAARAAFERSLSELGLDYVDLYLIHWPLARSTDYVATWETLLELRASGRAREVGVSNFQPEHLRKISAATGEAPAVNQVEIHPYLAQNPLRALHHELGVVTEAWSPLARGRVLGDPAIAGVAARLGRTPAQVVLRWHLQRGDVVIPKASTPARIAENLDVFGFALDAAAMAELDGLDRGQRTGSHPDAVELDQGRR